MKLSQSLDGIQQADAPKTTAKKVAPIVFTCGH